MKNTLKSLFKNDDVDTLKKRVADYEQHRNKLLEEADAIEATRAQNAIAATEGNDEARAALDRANVDAFEQRQKIDDFDVAIKEARRRLSDGEAKELAADRRENIDSLNKLFKGRLASAKAVEQYLESMAPELERMEQTAIEIIDLHRHLGGKAVHWSDRLDDTQRLAARLSLFAHGLGLGKWFGLDLPLVPVPRRLVDLEKEEHRRYSIDDADDHSTAA